MNSSAKAGNGLPRLCGCFCMTLLKRLSGACPPGAFQFGWAAFQLSLFFLPSSAFLAGIFLLISMVLGSRSRTEPFLRDRWNWPFLVAGIFMLCGSFFAYSGWTAWVGLANWLPFFWAFWALQPYLMNSFSRTRCAAWFVAGTVPVLITGFGQLWLGWEGPWQIFDGLIVWFVAPGGQPMGRLSGLFDYANIAGTWLAFVWPFSLACLVQPSLKKSQRMLVLILAISIVTALVLTDSRNAWGGLILALPFVLGPSRWLLILPLMAFVLVPVTLASLPGIDSNLQSLARKFVPDNIWARLTDIRYAEERTFSQTRLSQWGFALTLIAERPWLGWGAAAFPVLYYTITSNWFGHPHNLPLELSVSHGIPASICVVGTALALLIMALRRGVLLAEGVSFNAFDRAWWTSSLILIVIHGTDIPSFDSRLNIAGWILLAGLRCMILPAEERQLVRL